MVSLPAPGFPLLAVFGLPQALTSFAFSKSKTGPPLLRGVAGCATGSARPRRPSWERASKPLRFVPIVPSLREDPNSHVGRG